MGTTAERPYILVDVDGVLNAISCQRVKSCDCHAGWVRTRALGFPLLLNPAHGPALLNLAKETGSELAWGSTWENLANEHIGPVIGLPELPWARMPPQHWRHAHKADGFVPWVAGRPFIWFDDEPDAPGAAAALASQPHLVITVDEVAGLTDEHIAAAQVWLRKRETAPPGTGEAVTP